MVTEQTAFVTTSNWVGDYFTTTAGVSYVTDFDVVCIYAFFEFLLQPSTFTICTTGCERSPRCIWSWLELQLHHVTSPLYCTIVQALIHSILFLIKSHYFALCLSNNENDNGDHTYDESGYSHYVARNPPSMGRMMPFTILAASLKRNAMTDEISETSAHLSRKYHY